MKKPIIKLIKVVIKAGKKIITGQDNSLSTNDVTDDIQLNNFPIDSSTDIGIVQPTTEFLEIEPTADSTTPTPVFVNGIEDEWSFEKAFEFARNQEGKYGCFEYRGTIYNCLIKEEANKITDDELRNWGMACNDKFNHFMNDEFIPTYECTELSDEVKPKVPEMNVSSLPEENETSFWDELFQELFGE